MARLSAIEPHDAELFAASVRRSAPVSDDEVRLMLENARARELERGEFLLRAGDYANEVAFVVHGLLREYFVMHDGIERTKAFVVAGQGSGSLADLLSGAPSRAFIVSEEPSRLLVIAYGHYRALLETKPGWALYGQRLLERLFLAKAEREYELLGLDAEERYRRFVARFPGLEARVAARHVASYLGVTPVHLSRLRRRRRKRLPA